MFVLSFVGVMGRTVHRMKAAMARFPIIALSAYMLYSDVTSG